MNPLGRVGEMAESTDKHIESALRMVVDAGFPVSAGVLVVHMIVERVGTRLERETALADAAGEP